MQQQRTNKYAQRKIYKAAQSTLEQCTELLETLAKLKQKHVGFQTQNYSFKFD